MKSSDSNLPSPVVIDSPNQNAQDRKHLERVMGLLAGKTPANAQVILCAEEPSDSFHPDLTVELVRERALLESSQLDEVAARLLPLVERAIDALAQGRTQISRLEAVAPDPDCLSRTYGRILTSSN